jgi:hypothetical protein
MGNLLLKGVKTRVNRERVPKNCPESLPAQIPIVNALVENDVQKHITFHGSQGRGVAESGQVSENGGMNTKGRIREHRKYFFKHPHDRSKQHQTSNDNEESDFRESGKLPDVAKLLRQGGNSTGPVGNAQPAVEEPRSVLTGEKEGEQEVVQEVHLRKTKGKELEI